MARSKAQNGIVELQASVEPRRVRNLSDLTAHNLGGLFSSKSLETHAIRDALVSGDAAPKDARSTVESSISLSKGRIRIVFCSIVKHLKTL